MHFKVLSHDDDEDKNIKDDVYHFVAIRFFL